MESVDVTIHFPMLHELPKIAAFIADLNQISKNYIGYCGTTYEEVFHTITEDFGDVEAVDAFVVAERSGKIVGLLGFDADFKRGRAELWGPFTEPRSLELSRRLWRNLPLPQRVDEVEVFCDQDNYVCLAFAKQELFVTEPSNLILEVYKSPSFNKNDEFATPLTNSETEEFISLHNQLFPGTYYDGSEIVSYINDLRKVFVVSHRKEVVGYIYAEAEPEFGDARIEFIGVKLQYRRKGIGTRLVRSALSWLFSFSEINEVKLVVSENDSTARALYRAAGFEVKHEMFSARRIL